MYNFDFLNSPFANHVTPKFIERQITLLYQDSRELYDKVSSIALKVAITKILYDDAITCGYQPLIDAAKLHYERSIENVKNLFYS